MTAQQVRTVQDLFAAAARGAVEEMTACLHEDVVVVQGHGLPYQGTYGGRQGFLDMLDALVSRYEIGQRNLVTHDTGDGDIGAIVTFDVDFRARATGRTGSSGNVELYRFTDGLISSIDIYYKDAVAVAALLEPLADATGTPAAGDDAEPAGPLASVPSGASGAGDPR